MTNEQTEALEFLRSVGGDVDKLLPEKVMNNVSTLIAEPVEDKQDRTIVFTEAFTSNRLGKLFWANGAYLVTRQTIRILREEWQVVNRRDGIRAARLPFFDLTRKLPILTDAVRRSLS